MLLFCLVFSLTKHEFCFVHIFFKSYIQYFLWLKLYFFFWRTPEASSMTDMPQAVTARTLCPTDTSPKNPRPPHWHTYLLTVEIFTIRVRGNTRVRAQQKGIVRATHQDFLQPYRSETWCLTHPPVEPRSRSKEKVKVGQNVRKHLPGTCSATESTPGVHQPDGSSFFFWRWGYIFFIYFLFLIFISFSGFSCQRRIQDETGTAHDEDRRNWTGTDGNSQPEQASTGDAGRSYNGGSTGTMTITGQVRWRQRQ